MSYNASNISVLEGLEPVRKRPGMYVGSTSVKGLNHLIYEILDNSVDEHLAGHCNNITVSINKDGSATIEDDGRGIPVDLHEKGYPAERIIMTTLHAGGKFDNSNYKTSGGLHGVGSSVVNALSVKMIVEVKRDGQIYYDEYSKGVPTIKLKKGELLPTRGKAKGTGTKITFYPDDLIFDTVKFKAESVRERLRETAYLNPSLSITFVNARDDKEPEVFHEPNGIAGFVDSLILQESESKRLTNTVAIAGEKDGIQINVAFAYTGRFGDNVVSFCNNINTMEGGTHVNGFKSGFAKVVNQYARELGNLKNKDQSFTGNDTRNGMTAVISVSHPAPRFEGQTKTKLDNTDVQSAIVSILNSELQHYFDRNLEALKTIISRAEMAAKVRKEEEKIRTNLADKKFAFEGNGKLARQESNDASKCEIFIVEGKSAGGTAKTGRDRRYQAILPIRGKILNVEKQSVDRVLANEEIKAIVNALGCGFSQGYGNDFNIDNLKYSKIIIAADADVDGGHISTLLLTLFYRFMPELIYAGKLYRAMPPLYRALPDVRDGLKPVHRRILWAMKSLGLSSTGDYKKAARVVGETMGKYHPHGDASIYDAMVHMAQDWCYNHPLVDGHGNFGSVEGDDAAASRYTEARLSAIAEDVLLSDLDKGVVDFIPNFDNKEKEPTVLPAVIPNILISGTDGIAVGMACKMPTHNLGEVIDAATAMIDNPKMKEEKIFDYIKGPDFATGGIIVNKSELPEIYKNGVGRIRIRGKVKTETGERGKTNIVISEIPFTMIGGIDKFMDTVADLVRAKVMPDVVDIKNFSGKDGVRIVIELRKGADAQQYINLLYKKAKLEDTFGYNAMLLSNGVPAQMSLHRIITEFLEFYRETMTRKYKTLLDREKKAAEVREGLMTAVDCIDTIIEVFRGSTVVAMAKKCLTKGVTDGIKFKTKTAEKQAKKFCFTELQADAILEMKMQKIIGLEMSILEKELAKAKKNIEVYSGLLSSKVKMNHKMKADMLEIKERYAKKRKTEIVDAEAIVIKKPEIKEEKVYALVNRFGYIKLVDEATYERNKENIPSDYRYVCEVMNTGKLYIFTEGGKCHQIKAMSVPMGRYNDKGVPLEQVSALTTDEVAVAVISDYKPKEKLLFVTRKGYVKRVVISEFDTTRKTTDATKLSKEDSVFAVLPIKEKKSVVIISKQKLCVSFELSSVSLLKKATVGVVGMKFDKNDEVDFVTTTPDGNFDYNNKRYNLDKLNAGKRATKGKKI